MKNKTQIEQQDKFISSIASVQFNICDLSNLIIAEYHSGEKLDEDNCELEFSRKMDSNNEMLNLKMKWFYRDNVRPKYYQAKREMYKMLDRHSEIPNSDFNVNSWLDNFNQYGEYQDFVGDYFTGKYRKKFGWAFIPELDKHK